MTARDRALLRHLVDAGLAPEFVDSYGRKWLVTAGDWCCEWNPLTSRDDAMGAMEKWRTGSELRRWEVSSPGGIKHEFVVALISIETNIRVVSSGGKELPRAICEVLAKATGFKLQEEGNV